MDVRSDLIQLKDSLEEEAGQANDLYHCLILSEYGIEYMDGNNRQLEAGALHGLSRLAGLLVKQLQDNVEFLSLMIERVQRDENHK